MFFLFYVLLFSSLRRVHLFVTHYLLSPFRFTTNAPPKGNNTNFDDESRFVLFFSKAYFGIKINNN